MWTNHLRISRPRAARLIILLAVMAVSAQRMWAVSIEYQVTNLGQNLFRYDYLVSGIQFQANQELDIRFDPDLYGPVKNGVAGAGFDLLLLQPNNPPGTSGDFSALALVDGPALSPFRVDVMFLGSGTPGGQPFFINQYDSGGSLVKAIGSGDTTAGGDAPEPAAWTLGAAGFILFGALRAVRRTA